MRFLYSALVVLALAACSETPPPAPLEPLQFNSPTYTLNVATITVAQDYHSPRRPPNVEYLSDITPTQAVKQWAATRLVAAGHQNSFEVDIKDAAIVKTELPKQKTGIVGMFTTEQTEQYDGTLTVELRIYSPQSVLAVAHAEVTVQQRLTLPENTTPIDRQRLYHQMTLDLMKALEAEIDANIRQHLSSYLM
jgi:hypothetical protein